MKPRDKEIKIHESHPHSVFLVFETGTSAIFPVGVFF